MKQSSQAAFLFVSKVIHSKFKGMDGKSAHRGIKVSWWILMRVPVYECIVYANSLACLCWWVCGIMCVCNVCNISLHNVCGGVCTWIPFLALTQILYLPGKLWEVLVCVLFSWTSTYPCLSFHLLSMMTPSIFLIIIILSFIISLSSPFLCSSVFSSSSYLPLVSPQDSLNPELYSTGSNSSKMLLHKYFIYMS